MSQIELDAMDKRILAALQGDLDDSPEPYGRLAEDLNISEDEVVERIKNLQRQGVIRRMGAMIRHIEAGIGFNGMVVWKVAPERVDDVGNLLATFPEVTHCYERTPFGRTGGTLFTMVHSSSEEGCRETVRMMSEKVGVSDYEILFSERELKKVSMTYFDDEDQ
ncbi:MAG TPA: AsnC family transcriptional regulator [Desulfomonilaceae bacterium]|nr:AsnC family transcriptional regulator [Desulfomonilaceae bacterium]